MTDCRQIVTLSLCGCIAVLFLEQWKRRQISLSFSWDLTGIEEDEVNNEHLLMPGHKHRNDTKRTALYSSSERVEVLFYKYSVLVQLFDVTDYLLRVCFIILDEYVLDK